MTELIRIGVDGRYQGQPLTGVPRYIDELCKQLDVLLPEARFYLYATSANGIKVPSSRWMLRIEPNRLLAKLKPNIWWKFFAHRLIRKDALDVLWASAGFLPAKIARVKCILTIYDLTFRLFPETMSFSNLWAHRIFLSKDLKRADGVVAISNGTHQRLRDFYGRGADLIVRPDASQHFRPRDIHIQERVKIKYGLKQPFLLAVSTLEPRKNLINLIRAFLDLKRRGELLNHDLVLIGKKGWKDAALASSMTSVEENNIKSLGFVPDEDLPALYSACALFCMPSLYEGFGLPVLEARRCGARVITTDLPELREAGDSQCTYADTDAASIADGVTRALATAASLHPDIAIGSTWLDGAKKLAAELVAVACSRSSYPAAP